MDKTTNKTSGRASLSERIARASAVRDQAVSKKPDRELLDAERRSAFDATDTLKDLWEDKPAINELELVKALITQIVLLDDDLREQVLCRANIVARECAAAVAPYLRVQS